ncbi:MAG: hypothetical protein ACTSPQ_18335 [Candidatus Helarchaeota archaeon]
MKKMRRYKIILLLAIFLFTGTVSIGIFPINVDASKVIVLPDYKPIDIGPRIREKDFLLKSDFSMRSSSTPKSSAAATSAISDLTILDAKYWLVLDTKTGYFFDVFYLVAESDNVQIWVQEDLSWLEGDPREYPLILQEQVDYLMEEFDDNIYSVDTEYFGTPDFHNGLYSLLEAWNKVPPGYYADSNGRNVILVSNIRDDSYYDPTFPGYIAGFYSPSFEAFFDRNIINIDCYDWIHRIGNEGYNWIQGEFVNRPNLYESTIAHEYQHLIHDDWFPMDKTWMNEACSLFAEPLCGYELDVSQINWTLATPDNSLTYWGEQGNKNILADYGNSFLWALYLTDHYGFDFLQKYVQANWLFNPDLGWQYIDAPLEPKERITYILPDGIDFYNVYHDWRIANLIHSDYKGQDKYNYNLEELREFTGNNNIRINWDELIPLKTLNVKGMVNKWTSAENYFGETLSIKGDPTGYSKLGPFATDYIQFDSLRGISLIQFLGDNLAIYGWTYDDNIGAWWSGSEDELNTLLITNEFTAGSNDILKINTKWDIEKSWDFGFIQISTDGGNTWTSMEDLNGFTTYEIDSNAYPGFEDMLPGITGNYSEEWITLTFNIANYIETDQNYIIGFRYATDWALHEKGWYIKDVFINGKSIDELKPIYPDAKFMVSIVQKMETKIYTKYFIYDMFMPNFCGINYGIDLAYICRFEDYILIVSTIMDDGYTDYKFKAKSWGYHFGWFK